MPDVYGTYLSSKFSFSFISAAAVKQNSRLRDIQIEYWTFHFVRVLSEKKKKENNDVIWVKVSLHPSGALVRKALCVS